MKTKIILYLTVLLLGVAHSGNSQSSNEWQMVLNNDLSAFKIKMVNSELTFYFNPLRDTLSFSQGNKKPIKAGIFVEVTLKNNNKVVFASNEKNLTSDKTEIVIPMADVYNLLNNIKLPSKPKYQIAIKEKNIVKEKFSFEFTDK